MKILFIIAISCLISSCDAREKRNDNNIIAQKDIIIDTRIEQLKQTFERKDYTSFFKLFPDTYSELVDFYGFDDDAGEKPLYGFYEAHINYFFKYKGKISSKIFARKVYEIAKNGIWDADGIGLFQSNSLKIITCNPDVFLEILMTKPDEEVTIFWHFVFDGSDKYDLQNKEMFETIYRKINSRNKKQGKLLKEEFENMYK